jgi:IS30 family transposase
MTYNQLTQEKRYQIYALLRIEQSKTKIAEVIGVHRSTISREIRRNHGQKGYRPKQAQRYALARRKRTKRRIGPEVWDLVENRLRQEWSPEQIAESMKKVGQRISHERIYQHVYADKHNGGRLWKHLRCQKRRRKRAGSYERRGKIPGRISIDERPEEVEQRNRLGDWEGDTIIGANHKGAVLTLVDRKSGYTLLGKLSRRESQQVVDQAEKLLNAVGHVKTLTVDNGKEFAKHAKIREQTGVEVYFAHPYSSWERGTNENTNGLIRQYLPKKRRLDDVCEEELEHIMSRLNHRPRKRLAYRTPHEVFFEELVALET